MAQKSKRERIRDSYQEELREVRTVGELLKFAETLPLEVGRPFVDSLTGMMKQVWGGKELIDAEELRARHMGSGSRRMRRLRAADSLYDMKVVVAIATRVRHSAKGHESHPDVEFLLKLLSDNEWDNRVKGSPISATP